MIVSPFGNLEFGDEAGLLDWLQAHAARHTMYRKIAVNNGVNLPTTPVLESGPVDDDWLARHLFNHMTWARIFLPDNSIATVELATPTWKSKPEFYEWHQANNNAHTRIDQALGLP